MTNEYFVELIKTDFQTILTGTSTEFLLSCLSAWENHLKTGSKKSIRRSIVECHPSLISGDEFKVIFPYVYIPSEDLMVIIAHVEPLLTALELHKL